MNLPNIPATQELKSIFLEQNKVRVFVRREDSIHPLISGNKWRKLYYNLKQAKLRGNNTLLTFGGAFSNHIAATAQAGKENGFKTIGVIRGEETIPLNNTLKNALNNGMQLHYVSREKYRNKHTLIVKEELKAKFNSFYLIPEGGSNYYGTNGCMEILTKKDAIFNYIACPAGTGCTAAGIGMTLHKNQKLLVFPALKKGDFIKKEITNYIKEVTNDDELTAFFIKKIILHTNYHFGGYAKINTDFISFLQSFYSQYGIKWDGIYNGKMAYGIFDLIQKNYFPKNSTILFIHTGGIQGIEGLEKRYKTVIY